MKTFGKKFIYEKFSCIFKKKIFCTCVPITVLNEWKIKIAKARQRKANTVHLLGTSSTIRFTVFPVLIIEAIFDLEVVKEAVRGATCLAEGPQVHQ